MITTYIFMVYCLTCKDYPNDKVLAAYETIEHCQEAVLTLFGFGSGDRFSCISIPYIHNK